MELIYNDKKYYNGLYDKILNMEFGETPLNHKNDYEKQKFENHIKHWISTKEFESSFDFYIELSNDYTALLKKHTHGKFV